MARIYLAKAGGIGAFERYVVLKTISPDRAGDQRFVTMFLDEARLAATLNHQNIAQVYEVDEADGNLFITMEYVHGENLRHILESTLRKGWTIPVELAVMIVSSASAGLHHAHERKGKNGQPLNIVHRDVSPANIMVGYDGSVKLLDFGIAKAEERSTKTQQGTIKGKYGYMSPEQCRGKPIDRRSDIFALGIVLYEITTLRRAFRGNDDFDTMKRIVNGDLVPPSVAVPSYPRELEAIVLTAMARDPDYRFQTTQEMLEALDAFMQRAKLSGSPSAMARFMTQLYGSRREPWVESNAAAAADRMKRPTEPTAPQGERTEISPRELEPDSTNDATAVLDPGEYNATLRDVDTRELDVHDTNNSTTQPTRTVPGALPTSNVSTTQETIEPEHLGWAAPRPPARPEAAQDAAAWNQPAPMPASRRSGPIPTGNEVLPEYTPRQTERGLGGTAAAVRRPSTQRPAQVPAAALSSSPGVSVSNASGPQAALDPAPVPSVRPSRTPMYILIAVVVAVVAVVAGSIAIGLMHEKKGDPAKSSTPSGSGAGSGS
jgi:serine/threonine protein kinase